MRVECCYPTQAKVRLEWGTQPLLPVKQDGAPGFLATLHSLTPAWCGSICPKTGLQVHYYSCLPLITANCPRPAKRLALGVPGDIYWSHKFTDGAEPKCLGKGLQSLCLVVQFHPAPPPHPLQCPPERSPAPAGTTASVKQSLECADSPNETHKWPIPGCFWSMMMKLCG
jgi:hypothetical protein